MEASFAKNMHQKLIEVTSFMSTKEYKRTRISLINPFPRFRRIPIPLTNKCYFLFFYSSHIMNPMKAYQVQP